MIKYRLICKNCKTTFDSWFSSSTEYERLKKLDLNDEQHFIFLDYCKKYKVEPMTTIFSRSRLNFLESLDIDIIKVSSFDCASHQMIEELSDSKFKEIIVSTGCTFDDEIKKK